MAASDSLIRISGTTFDPKFQFVQNPSSNISLEASRRVERDGAILNWSFPMSQQIIFPESFRFHSRHYTLL